MLSASALDGTKSPKDGTEADRQGLLEAVPGESELVEEGGWSF